MSCASQPLISYFEVHCWRTRERAVSGSSGSHGSQQRAPDTRQAAHGPATAVILTDWSHKILTSLSETVTSQACVGRGGEREEKPWGWVGDTTVCLYVSVSFIRTWGWGGTLVRKKKSGRSTIHPGTMFDTSTNKAQVTLQHFLGSLNRNGDLLFIGA